MAFKWSNHHHHYYNHHHHHHRQQQHLNHHLILYIIILIIIYSNNVNLSAVKHNNLNKNYYYKAARLTKEFTLPINNVSLINDLIIQNDTNKIMNNSNNANNDNDSIIFATTTTILPLDNSNNNIDLNNLNNLNNDNVIDLNRKNYHNNNNNEALNQTSLNDTQSSMNYENRFRWIDSGRHQSFLPYISNMQSGFRNPTQMNNINNNNNNNKIPSPSSSLPVIVSTTTEATIESLNNYPNQKFMLNSPTPGSSLNNNNNNNNNNNLFPFDISSSILDENILFNVDLSSAKRPNMTRVEHIVAECSDEYMKVVIRFNGTFNGLIYSSGYVHDPKCIYVNGSGRNYYEFFIRLNQCGTLGRQEMYHPSLPGEARRRDHLMWNTLSIQYNTLIEEEFDEHFRLTCEYGSDFWKTVSFPFVNVEVNTGSPVMFTINPPQCQMEIRRGFGIAGTRTSGPVTVGDPLTLLIHMKSDRVGFDILVKNCIAHNGAQQRLQLIDANGCVTNEKLISPFRGTYKSDNGHQVSLYAYLKAFRFTGSLALYLECDIHMCHNRCPPQRCYWRNISKRSTNSQNVIAEFNTTETPSILSESISLVQALEVHHDQDEETASNKKDENLDKLNNSDAICLRPLSILSMIFFLLLLLTISFGLSIRFWMHLKQMRYLQNLQCIDFHNQKMLGHRNQHRQQPQSILHSTTASYSDSSSITSNNTSLPYSSYRGRFCRFS